MIVKSVWAFFEDEEKPELLLAWDIQEVERDEDGFKEACAAALETGRPIRGWRVIDVEVDVRAPKLAGRTLYLRHRRDQGGFVLRLESAADEDFEHASKLNREVEKAEGLTHASRGRVIHFEDGPMGKYYDFTVCGIKADKKRTTTDASLVTCGTCKRSQKFKEVQGGT